jgi:CheY-like chemotaxis protein
MTRAMLPPESVQIVERVTRLPVLIVEDDPDGQELISRILAFHHAPYQVVFSAEEALELVNHCQFAGAVIDLDLPDMDSWTLLKRLHANPATAFLPCVAMTAYHSAEMAGRARESGFKAYFPKPLDPRYFVADLEAVLYALPPQPARKVDR